MIQTPNLHIKQSYITFNLLHFVWFYRITRNIRRREFNNETDNFSCVRKYLKQKNKVRLLNDRIIMWFSSVSVRCTIIQFILFHFLLFLNQIYMYIKSNLYLLVNFLRCVEKFWNEKNLFVHFQRLPQKKVSSLNVPRMNLFRNNHKLLF